jgi:threonine/homoserine/homoserine lactone efflux protein
MTSVLLSYVLTCIAIELTPGPNMAYLAILSAERGRWMGFHAVLGVAIGLGLLGALAVFGIGALIAEQRVVYEALRWAGIAYLLYLAFDAWRDSRRPVENADLSNTGWRYFRRGLVNNVLNPKAALFYITVMPNFVVAGTPEIGQTMLLGAIYVMVATVIHAMVVLLAGSLQHLLLENSRRRRGMGLVFAALLVGVAVWVAVATAL